MRSTLRDTAWIRQAFLLPEHAIDDKFDTVRRLYTTADLSFTDTTLGGNFAINALPQFTRYADIKRKGLYNQGKGKGRFYHEAIEENYQLVHFRMGLPKFNSLTRFLGDFYNVEASSLARTGRSTGLFFEMGRAAGTVISLPLQPFLLGAKMIRFLIDKPASRFYYLKPAMPLYWNAVTTMVNGVAVNLGVIPRVFSDSQQSVNDKVEGISDFPGTDIQKYHKLLPDIYRADGGIDIYAVANRAQRLANAFNDALEKEVQNSTSQADLRARMRKMASWQPGKTDIGSGSLQEYLNKYLGGDDKNADGYYDKTAAAAQTSEGDRRDESYLNRALDFFQAERRMGSDFVTFRVDHTGSQSESFSNSTKEVGLASTMNSTSASARDTRFNFADGNIDTAGFSQAIVGAAKDFMGGVTQSLEIQGIAALAGSAFVDIPLMWNSSSADLNRTSFNIPLRSPYGHDLSRMQNLLIPMCMLIAMAVPLSTGKQSYTSPFILEMFNQGRSQVRLGMVDSLSFNRGVGDVGWTKDGKFLGVDVTISVVDLSSVLHMPINASFNATKAAVAAIGAGAGGAIASIGNALGGDYNVDNASNNGAAAASAVMPSTYDDDNTYTDYLAVLGSLPLEAQVNQFRKLRLRMTRQMADWNAWRSPAHLANWAMGGFTGDVIKALSTATDRP